MPQEQQQQQHHHHHHDPEEKEKRRKKQYKRMAKCLAKVWDLDDRFQEYSLSSEEEATGEDNHNNNGQRLITSLSQIGQKVDAQAYRVGKHGWEDFARDLGGVYNLHIHRYVLFFVLLL
jgi:hypothetical protein